MANEQKRIQLEKVAQKDDHIIFPDLRAVFCYLCIMATDWHEAANVNSIRLIAQALGFTKYRVRKCICTLREMGLVERTSCGCPAVESNTESGYELWYEARPPVNGFGLTEEGYNSKTYQEAIRILDEELAHWADDMEIEKEFM